MNRAQEKQNLIIAEFESIKSWEDRYKKVIQLGQELPEMDESLYQEKFLVKGCQSQVWLIASLNTQGEMELKADSDAMIVKGLVALLQKAYTGLKPEEVLKTPPHFIEELGFKDYLSPSRANGFLSMVKQIMLYAQAFSLTQS